ncbi:MAG: transglycosylase SLT domain-containing protein [Deltaproteobacteria bacterium]|jgi:membrane-bound lytic murein transglycosylase D|nr:transglycosylase SLT domain-containing protein [Deltaproteobacteria bacterium]MBW2537814.1 transglycosylase SLT domain-containing protein [Deltaproteobacteria bacterium]
MISALTFGYGVGMATPDSTLGEVQHAVDAFRTPSAEVAGRRLAQAPSVGQHEWAGRGPIDMAQTPAPPRPGVGVDPVSGREALESRELARLRRVGPDGGPRSCSADRPAYTEPPRYLSDSADGYQDFDDLDQASRDALSRLQLPDFNVPISQRALKYVRFLTRSDRGRGLFESWLKRSGRYQDLILEHLRERGLPEDLIWVAMIESGFDPRAKSPAGAVGLWQFMRPTGEVYGLDVSSYVDLRKHPVAATQAASHHLRDLYQRFGSWDLAMAAYNMGYEQLLSAISTYGTTDFTELSRQRAIPSETSNYVPKIVAAALVANNLERYGFDEVKLHKPIHTAELSVPAGSPLKTIAKAAGISAGTLRKYNPHLLTGHVPPRGDTVVLLPADTLSRARAALPAMLDRRLPSDAEVLDPMDWLGNGGSRRAHRYEQWNEDENLLALLPKPKRRSARSVLRGRAPLRPPTDDSLEPIAQEFSPRRSDRETVMYRVGPGDTLLGVARQFVVDIEDLASDNGLEVDDKLREGALLKLMVKREVLERWTKRRSGATTPRSKSEEQKVDRKKSAKKGA